MISFRYIFFLFSLYAISSQAQQYTWVQSYPLDYNMNPAMIQTATATDGDDHVYLWTMRNVNHLYGSRAFGDLALTKYDVGGNEIYSKTIYGYGGIITMKDDGHGTEFP